MNKIYNACDVIINMAHSEGFGLQTIESMMAGTPSIVSDIGNHSNMVGKAGYLIKPSVSHLTGGFGAEYIYEHYVSKKDVVEQLNYCYYNREDLKMKADICREQGLKFDIKDSAEKLLRKFDIIGKYKKANRPSYQVLTN